MNSHPSGKWKDQDEGSGLGLPGPGKRAPGAVPREFGIEVRTQFGRRRRSDGMDALEVVMSTKFVH